MCKLHCSNSSLRAPVVKGVHFELLVCWGCGDLCLAECFTSHFSVSISYTSLTAIYLITSNMSIRHQSKRTTEQMKPSCKTKRCSTVSMSSSARSGSTRSKLRDGENSEGLHQVKTEQRIKQRIQGHRY